MTNNSDSHSINQGNNTQKLFLNPNLLIVFCITMIAILGVSSITPAFHKISKELHLSAKEVTLLITMFTLPGIVLTPVFGVLSDRIGRRKVLVPSLFLFAIAGVLCAFTKDFNLILILRFFQGVGSASLGSLNATIIGDIFSGNERIEAMGYNSSIISISTAGFPIIGGLLATFGWNYPFLLPILALPVGLLVLYVLKNPEPKSDQNLREYFRTTFKSISNWKVFGILCSCFLTFLILYGSFLSYLPFLIGKKFEAEPFTIGLIMASSSLASGLTSTQLKRLTKYFPEQNLMRISTILYGISMLLVPFIENIWLLMLPTLLFGFAMAINFPSLQALLANVAETNQRGAVMSVNGMVFRLGQTLGPLIMVPVFHLWGTNGTFYTGAGIAVLMFVVINITLIERKK